MKLVRYAVVASIFAIIGYESPAIFAIIGYKNPASANSCLNVNVFGLFDESGLRESDFGIYTAGTFRIDGEEDESKQPMFNLAVVNCEKQTNNAGNLECKVTRASVEASPDKPSLDNPNCSLDLEFSAYQMKELQTGILSGMEPLGSTSCYDSLLTINRNTKKVSMSFSRTKYADNYDKTTAGTCGAAPHTQVLMNCTAWAKIRNKGQTPPRYCDFSSSGDKAH